MPDSATRPAPARRGAAKLDADRLSDVLAGKGQPPAVPAGAEQRSVAPAPAAAQPPVRRETRGISTSLEVPVYLMDNIAAYLRTNGGHNMRTLLFTGLAQLGIEVAPQDLVPQRRRRSR